MAFPVGVSVVECTVPAPISAFDGEVAELKATMEILAGSRAILWDATGQELSKMIEKVDSISGEITFTTPAVDQDGFRDASGVAITNWAVRVISWAVVDGAPGPKTYRVFQPKLADVAGGLNVAEIPDNTIPGGSLTAGVPSYASLMARLDALESLDIVTTTALAAAINGVLDGAPGALDTLNEIAAALGDDANYAATITAALATKVAATRQVNGHPLSADVTVSKSDVGLALAENIALSTLVQWARNPDQLVVGAITRDANNAITSAPVVWPDGTVGTYTADTLSVDFPGAVDAYHITYGSPATKTFTQPAVTRNTDGAVTNLPAIVVT